MCAGANSGPDHIQNRFACSGMGELLGGAAWSAWAGRSLSGRLHNYSDVI